MARVPEQELELLLAFLHTKTLPDPLGNADGLAAWLADEGLIEPDVAVTEEHARHARHVRAAMLNLLADPSGGSDARTRPTLESVTREAPLRVVIGGRAKLDLVAAGEGVDHALAELVAIAYRAGVRGEFDRMKTCPGCGWSFIDVSKNRSRVWCEMAKCGSQRKAKAYRLRAKANAAG